MYLALLRTVFFLSAVSWLLLFFVFEQPYDIQWHAIYIVTFTLTLVHQITYAFAVRFLCDNLIDLLWLAGDLAGLLYYTVTTGSWYFYSGDSQLDVVQSILLWCLMILLPILLLSRAYFWFQDRKRVSKRPSCLQELKAVGLWTFLSGIFAAVFGSSLVHILFGTQPISVFGLAHHWKRGAIRKAYRTKYPAILDEMSVPQHQRGLLCLIQDHIIDLNLMDEAVEYPDVAFESRTKSMELMRPETI